MPIGMGEVFNTEMRNPEVVGFSFQKVSKISRFFRFGGHCILKNPNLSTGCYSIMGQNMGQEAFPFPGQNFIQPQGVAILP